jgi:pachytene checkpoint protein 2
MRPISREWRGLIQTPDARMPEASSGQAWREDRYGFLRWMVLPQPEWRAWWDRIYVPEDVKDRLRAYVEFSLRHRADFSRVGLPVHGIALLYGPPGTGKSSLARGVAQVVAERLVEDGVSEEVIFAEVDPHALPSQMLGESQRNTMNLLEKSLPELAAKGRPVVVVIDEVNTLATSRSLATGGRDPVDVMRATEAALRGIDYLAAAAPNVVVLGTSNFVATIDEAMLDRMDLAVEIQLPAAVEIEAILRDTMAELPAVAIADREYQDLAGMLVGRSGRDIRKLVLEAIVTRQGPIDSELTVDHIERAFTRGRFGHA